MKLASQLKVMKFFQKIALNFRRRIDRLSGAYEYQAFCLLQLSFVVLFILRGIDKIIYYFTAWTKFHSIATTQFFQGTQRGFLLAVGIVEIIIGIGVIFKPKFFAYLIVIWSLVVLINFLTMDEGFDIALRDFGLLLSALALGRLSHKYGN